MPCKASIQASSLLSPVGIGLAALDKV